MPCPTRSTPKNSTASRIFSGPPISPAWIKRCNPQSAAFRYTPRNSLLRMLNSSPPIPNATIREHSHRWFRPELPHRIENPVQLQPFLLKRLRRFQDCLEVRLRFLLAQQHHSD